METYRTVGAYEAKTKLSALLELVARGEEIVITRHDRPVARLVPAGRRQTTQDLFRRVRALRDRLKLRQGESPKDLVEAGRRI